MPKPIIEQAGAIAYTVTESIPRVLIVRAKKDPAHWIFPKGHIDPGETAEVAGVRELEEEAGVTGRIVREAGVEHFDYNDKMYRVTYFLVRYASETGTPEAGREPRFCAVDEALTLLSFPAARALLAKMRPFMA